MSNEARLLLTPRQAAAALATSERTLWSLTKPRGPIPAVRFGRSVRYSTATLAAWVEAKQQPQTDAANKNGPPLEPASRSNGHPANGMEVTS